MRPLHMLYYSVALNHADCNVNTAIDAQPKFSTRPPELDSFPAMEKRKTLLALVVSEKITLRVTPNLSICAGLN